MPDIADWNRSIDRLGGLHLRRLGQRAAASAVTTANIRVPVTRALAEAMFAQQRTFFSFGATG